ncbi:MAG: transglutaminase-like domain-containing protein [Clostridia bacterium]|nr:transglutaminase-like domain-containing protein [Clostridia bacterium]
MLKKFVLLALVISIVAACFSPAITYAKVLDNTSLDKHVEKIVNNKVKLSGNVKKKLRKLFNYIEKNYNYIRTTDFKTYDGWAGDYALDMYSCKKGSCYHFAAAYAFLAKKVSKYKVRIVVGKTNGFTEVLQDHAWVEIKINSRWYICDPNMDKYAEKSSGKYFLKKRNDLKKTYDNFENVKYFNL